MTYYKEYLAFLNNIGSILVFLKGYRPTCNSLTRNFISVPAEEQGRISLVARYSGSIPDFVRTKWNRKFLDKINYFHSFLKHFIRFRYTWIPEDIRHCGSGRKIWLFLSPDHHWARPELNHRENQYFWGSLRNFSKIFKFSEFFVNRVPSVKISNLKIFSIEIFFCDSRFRKMGFKGQKLNTEMVKVNISKMDQKLTKLIPKF